MKNRPSAGFAAIETVVMIVIIAGIAGIGLFVAHRMNTAQTAQQSNEAVQDAPATAVPAVTKASDLDTAQKTLDQADVDASASDSSQLDAELNNF